MPRYKLTIAYDGTDFSGWQKQEPPDPDATPDDLGNRPRIKLRTVQEIVEQAVREVVREPINLHGASRTDAGVHALSQCAAFTTVGNANDGRGWPEERGTDPLLRAINGRLPADVLVRDIQLTRDDFNPIADAISKGYSYTLHVSRERTLWDRNYVHHVWEELDIESMQAAVKHLIGEHDFNAFAAAGHGRQSTVRTIFDCSVDAITHPDPSVRAASGSERYPPPISPTQRIRINISGNGFLYNMVRIIAGTLYDVGRGNKKPEDIPTIIESRDRRNSGMTLPPTGLRLEWISYNPDQ